MTTLLQDIPKFELQPYKSLSNEELSARIEKVREALGPRLVILGHHYQQDEVVALADLRGDSYKLSEQAAADEQCESIVFCGVHFMAEIDQVEDCWQQLAEVIDTDDVMPITYVNSAASLKAFCGRHGGIVCTSANADAALHVEGNHSVLKRRLFRQLRGLDCQYGNVVAE